MLREAIRAVERFDVRIQHPQTVISDFELAIINAVKNVFNTASVRLCLFHPCQSIYRRIQSEGLQQQYMDPNDDSIQRASNSMCAFWFLYLLQKCHKFLINGTMRHLTVLCPLQIILKLPYTYEELRHEGEEERCPYTLKSNLRKFEQFSPKQCIGRLENAYFSRICEFKLVNLNLNSQVSYI